ncbi:unnamed protein product [Phytophthora fragariaefolia]|uniref:Unnamed protein product n=1 Tax=Phytophthora fragariaefolia TaxID=1490495 RepID=A0A9W7CV51_9STRA|nr:unnamed protein product [Phytophthora fragariaefolia]
MESAIDGGDRVPKRNASAEAIAEQGTHSTTQVNTLPACRPGIQRRGGFAGNRSIGEPSHQSCAQRIKETELKALNKIPEVLYVDEQTLVETNLPAQRMQPIPQKETHAESRTVEEPQVTAVTRNQSRCVWFAESTKHRPTSQEAANEVGDLPVDQESPISPQGGAQRSVREGSCNVETTLDEPARADPKEASEREDPTTVQAERIRRLRVAQDEERRWADLKAYLNGDVESLSFKRPANARKLADRFVLDKAGLLKYVGKGRKLDEVGEHEPQLRLVIPTTMIDEQREPHLKGYSSGNVLAQRPFQLLSMDVVTPLPKPRRGNTSLLLLQCSFMGYVIAKAMSSTKAQDVADEFEEYVFRRFGAPTMVRHDRDPRFMSETFKAFTELIQARSRATLSYRPQANGQQERSVKSIMQTVNVYVEDPLQRDWDDIAEKMAHAINNSMDTTRKETPFYLVHGWDAQSPLKAMTISWRLGDGSLTDAAAWRREANHQHEVALAMEKQYQATEKARRTKEHNEALGRLERMAVPVDERSNPTEVGDLTSDPTYRPLFEPGSRVWLFMERVKPGLTKKLAHRWHGPFRIKRKVEEFAYELELPDKAGYRFYPDNRFDFDEELLPEDSWEPEAGDDEYIVEAILDDRWPISTGTWRNQREFYVPTWEPVSNLSCEGLLLDYLLQRKRENRFEMVQVAEES